MGNPLSGPRRLAQSPTSHGVLTISSGMGEAQSLGGPRSSKHPVDHVHCETHLTASQRYQEFLRGDAAVMANRPRTVGTPPTSVRPAREATAPRQCCINRPSRAMLRCPSGSGIVRPESALGLLKNLDFLPGRVSSRGVTSHSRMSAPDPCRRCDASN